MGLKDPLLLARKMHPRFAQAKDRATMAPWRRVTAETAVTAPFSHPMHSLMNITLFEYEIRRHLSQKDRRKP
jgi:hypothetical protein